ncbi:hypothetical protein EDD99_5605 [Streptomyces sp. 846.5]|nr:hypothetical protein [Streptomyces sp. 846.5]TDT97467.1 hypothetical protein EDD99_5605 [Streptomyces sp. 846.5]
MTSTWERIDRAGRPYRVTDNPFLAATVTTVPEHGEKIALSAGYPHVPGERTRLSYFVDEAVKDAGFTVSASLNPTAVKVIHEPSVDLLTGKGPQSVDAQAARIRTIVSRQLLGSARRPGEQLRVGQLHVRVGRPGRVHLGAVQAAADHHVGRGRPAAPSINGPCHTSTLTSPFKMVDPSDRDPAEFGRGQYRSS